MQAQQNFKENLSREFKNGGIFVSINFTSRAVYIAMYIRRSFESLHRCQNPRFGLLCLSSLVNPYPELNTERAKCNARTRLPIYRVRISSRVSSWIFELGYFWRDFLAGFPINFQWFYTTYSVSGVAHRLEAGWAPA